METGAGDGADWSTCPTETAKVKVFKIEPAFESYLPGGLTIKASLYLTGFVGKSGS